MAGFARHLRFAASVAIVGGVVCGAREAVLTLQANAAIQAGQYLFVYLAVPILAWVILATAVLMPLAFAVAAVFPQTDERVWFWLYGGGLGLVAASSVILPWSAETIARLRNVGFAHVGAAQITLLVLAITFILAVAGVAAAAGAWYAQRRVHPLRYAVRVALLIVVVLLWPVAHFFATDWTWLPGDTAKAAAASISRPNVVLLSIDTLRADHLGSYGDTHHLTPHLDNLARQGVVFEQTITSAPWTLPAMASLFTGLYPHHHGAGIITNRRDPLGRSALPADTWTLATALHEAGYRTHAIVTNPYLALRYGFGAGFDTYENVTIESEAFLAFAHTTAVRLLTWAWPSVVVGDRGATVSSRAIKWLAHAPAHRPFFLWLHYVDPHAPYSHPGLSKNKSFRGDISFGAPAQEARDITLTSPDVARLRSGEIRLNAAEKEDVRNLYREEVHAVDAAIGAVLDALDAQGFADHTIVVCVADHGEEFWEHGGVEHGQTVYEEVIRVPLIIRWPGRLPAGQRIRSVVRITDVAPTVLDLLDLPVPSGRDGATLLPLIRGEATPPRVALIENMLFADERIGVRTATQTYVRWATGKEEIYDLQTDPHEQRDLAGNDELLVALRSTYDGIDHVATHVQTVGAPVLDLRAAEGLRSLGYVQ